MDQDSAELKLTDVVDTLVTHAEEGDWDWINTFARLKAFKACSPFSMMQVKKTCTVVF